MGKLVPSFCGKSSSKNFDSLLIIQSKTKYEHSQSSLFDKIHCLACHSFLKQLS